MTQATAQLNYLKMTPRKVRLIADVLRGLPVLEAEAQLLLQRRRAALPLLKLLRSCVANAKAAKMNVGQMFVSKITVDGGPMMKRFLPRAQGRATPLQKKMSHVFIMIEESQKALPAPRFSIVRREKVKKEKSGEVKKSDRAEIKAESKKSSAKENVGFFKRIFNRKSV